MAGMTLMPKALCLTALVISFLVFLLFASDLLLGLAGMESAAPFKGAHRGIDIVFSVSAAILGVLSFFTFREQV